MSEPLRAPIVGSVAAVAHGTIYEWSCARSGCIGAGDEATAALAAAALSDHTRRAHEPGETA